MVLSVLLLIWGSVPVPTQAATATPTPDTWDSYEPNDASGEASVVSTGQTIRDLQLHNADVDWFKVWLKAGWTYRFNAVPTEGDPEMRLYDDGMTELVEALDDGAGDASARIEWTASSTGWHYVEAASQVAGLLGAYSLELLEVPATATPTQTPDPTMTPTPTETPTPGPTATPDTWDAYEPNDGTGEASVVSVGYTTQGLTLHDGDQDWFKTRLVGGREYQIEVTITGGGDPRLEVYDGDGTTLLAEADDGGAGNPSPNVTLRPSADGDVYVAVTSQVDGLFCEYDLTVLEMTPTATPTPMVPDAYEPDDDDPVEAAVQVAQVRAFEAEGDVDKVTFPVKAGKGYYVATSPSQGTDTILQVEVDGRLYQDDDGGDGTGSRIVFYPTRDGWAEVTVWEKWSRYGKDVTYDLAADVYEGVDPDESQDSEGGAMMALGTSQSRAFHTGDDVDYARLPVGEGVPVVVEVAGDGVIPHLTVRLDGKTWVADGSASGGRAEVQFTPSSGGEATIEVRSLSGEAGAYTLSIREGATPTEAPGTTPTPQPTSAVPDPYEVDDSVPAIYYPGQVQARAFQAGGDVDQVVFTAKAGKRYEARTTELAPGVDTVVTLYDFATGEALQSDDDGGKSVASLIAFGPYASERKVKLVVANRGRFGADATYALEIRRPTAEDGGGADDGPGAVTTFVFLDHDGDGAYDPLEGIDGVIVTLRIEGGSTMAMGTRNGRARFVLPASDEGLVCDVMVDLIGYGERVDVGPGGNAEVHIPVSPVPLPKRLP
jgi:hypothetical protein